MFKWLLKPSTLVGAAVVTVVAWGAYAFMGGDQFMDQNGGKWLITPPSKSDPHWRANCTNWQMVYGKLPVPITSAVGDSREQLIATIQEGAQAASPFVGGGS